MRGLARTASSRQPVQSLFDRDLVKASGQNGFFTSLCRTLHLNLSIQRFALMPAPQMQCLNRQELIAFLLEHLRPFPQRLDARLDRIARVFATGSGQKAFAGAFVIRTGSHVNLEGMLDWIAISACATTD
jgi:hypothetical protein